MCSSEEVHCRSARSTAGDNGFSDTRSIQVVSFHLRVIYRSCQWLLESFDLGSLCLLTFGGKSTVWQEISSRLDLMPKTQSLKEDASKLSMVTVGVIFKAIPLKQVKYGTVLHGPAGLAIFSCGIRLIPLEAVTDSCSLPKNSKKPSIGSVSLITGPFRKGTSLAVYYYPVLSGQHIATLIIQFLLVLPLYAITSGCCLSTPQYMPNIRSISSTITE